MIRIYNGAKVPVEGLIQYQDLKIEEEQDQLNVVSFNVPREEADLIEHEGYVEVKNNGRYVIKEKNYDDDDQVYEIVGLYDLEELQGYIESAAYVSMTITAMMDILLAGTGWTFVTNDTTIRTSTGVTIDRLDFIYAIVRDTFGLEIKFDNQARIIYADEMLGEDKGAYFSDEVNLTALTVDSDSYDFATRVIPRGKDGLSIEAINGGLPYLENLTYSSKIITKYWPDERYTVPENLKVAGQKILDGISKPLMSYSAKAQDLYRTHADDFGHLEYNVSDTITLINKETNTKEKQRIVKRVKYPDVPEDDTVTIANRIRSFISESQQDFDGVKQDFSVIRASLQLLDEKVLARVTQNVYTADKEAMDLAYAQVVLDIDGLEGQVLNLDGDVGTLALTANELTGRMQNAEGDIGALELTATNFEISLGSVEDDVAGVKVQITPDAIIETVESAVAVNGSTVLATKSDIEQTDEYWQARFSNQKIGGRNLLLNSGFEKGFGEWVLNTPETRIEYGQMNTMLEGNNALIITPPNDNGGGIYRAVYGLKIGQEYTFSIWCQTEGAQWWLGIFQLQNRTNVISQGGWSRFSLTFTATATSHILMIISYDAPIQRAMYLDNVQLEEGNVATAWALSPEEMYAGITKINKDGVNVGISTSEINTQLAYNGLRVSDAGTELASFGAGGAVVPNLQASKISGNVLNTIDSYQGYTIGNGRDFPTLTAALNAISGGKNKLLTINGVLELNVYGSINDDCLIEGFSGAGGINIGLKEGAVINGSIKVQGCSCGVFISGGVIKRTTKDSCVEIINSVLVDVGYIVLDANGGTYGLYARQGGTTLANNVDVVGAIIGLASFTGHTLKVFNCRGNTSYSSTRAYYGGLVFVFGTVPNCSGPTMEVHQAFAFSYGDPSKLDSAYSPPAVIPQTFSSTFGHTSVYTVGHDTASQDTYYGASAAQNRWDSSMAWKDGVFTFGGDIYNYWQGGYNVLVEMRVRRKNSSHGSSGGVAPAPYNFAPSESFNAVGRGIWTEWTTVPSSFFGSGGATLKFFNGVSGASGYAIWDAAEVKVTVTKNV